MEARVPKTPKLASILDVIDKYDNFFFDCDGVLWDASRDLEHAFDLLNYLEKKGKKLFFITNTSTNTREGFQGKFLKYGYDATVGQLYPSSYTTGRYIREKLPDIKKVYVFGMKGLADELNNHGIMTVGGSEDNEKKMSGAAFKELEVEKDIDALVAGYDMDLNYYKFCYSSLLLQLGKKFIATNEDAFDPIGDRKLPTSMIQISGLRNSMGVDPLIVGKPNPYAIDLIVGDNSLDKAKCIMIGDRLDTDILFANSGGIDSILLMTGVSKNKDLIESESIDGGPKPSYYLDSLKLDQTL